jgi:hypothetical protein
MAAPEQNGKGGMITPMGKWLNGQIVKWPAGKRDGKPRSEFLAGTLPEMPPARSCANTLKASKNTLLKCRAEIRLDGPAP